MMMMMMSMENLITLLGFLALTVVVAAEGQHNNECLPSSCGNISKISYPFRLKGDPAHCGDRRFELSCENNRTTLVLYSLKFYVLNISYYDYDDSYIHLLDANLERNMCYFPLYSVRFPDYYDVYLTYNTILLNCTEAVKSSKHIDASPCLNVSSKSNAAYMYVLSYNSSLADIPESCYIQATYPSSSSYIFYHFEKKKVPGTIVEICQYLRMGFTIQPRYHVRTRLTLLYRLNRIKDYFLERIWQILRVILFWSIISLGVGRTSLGFLCLLIICLYKLRQRHLSADNTIEEFLLSHNNLMPIRYSYSQIKQMTKGFKHELGHGGFGTVFKGKLRSGRSVAIKVLSKSKANGQDFINEVATIGRIHHVNVVRLIGFCVNGTKRALVYDFMQNGSLDAFIFSDKGKNVSLSWETMYDITLGVARGIEYLHRGCDMQILHFDIKPHNILLDENFVPKVSDFGLAKLYPANESIVFLTAARGTSGYIAPELFYKNLGPVSYKADVYSFGMLLLEIVGRRKNLNAFTDHTSRIYFPSWIYDRINEGDNLELGDISEGEEAIVRKMLIVAFWCIQVKPIDRPSMGKVLEMLQGDVDFLRVPSKPFLNPHEMQNEN